MRGAHAVVPAFPLRFVLFDFDGTLAETLTDLYHGVNHTLGVLDLPERSRAEVRRFVGNGVRVLLERSLGEENGDLLDEAFPVFEKWYAEHLLDHTTLLPGVVECLDHFREADLAVVSNKQAGYTRRIAEALGIADRFGLILGPESLESRKPSPHMIHAALESFGRAPEEGILVGDTPVDVEAGRAAAVHTVAVSGGFRTREELEPHSPDVIVDSLHELIRLYR